MNRSCREQTHLHVGARLGGRGRDWCAQQHRPGGHHRGTKENSDLACPHDDPILTYRRAEPSEQVRARRLGEADHLTTLDPHAVVTLLGTP